MQYPQQPGLQPDFYSGFYNLQQVNCSRFLAIYNPLSKNKKVRFFGNKFLPPLTFLVLTQSQP